MSTLIAIVGPTAVGKSDLPLALAESLGDQVATADTCRLDPTG